MSLSLSLSLPVGSLKTHVKQHSGGGLQILLSLLALIEQLQLELLVSSERVLSGEFLRLFRISNLLLSHRVGPASGGGRLVAQLQMIHHGGQTGG